MPLMWSWAGKIKPGTTSEARRGEGPIVWRSCNPYEGVWDLLEKPEETRKLVSVESR